MLGRPDPLPEDGSAVTKFVESEQGLVGGIMQVSEIDQNYEKWMARAFPSVTSIRVLGDSLAEGTGVEGGEDVPLRTWPAMIEAGYRTANPDLDFVNSGVFGATSFGVRREQLEPAVAAAPQVALVVCGGNDMLHPAFEVTKTGANFSEIAKKLVGAGTSVFLMTTFDNSETYGLPEPFGERVRTRCIPLRNMIAEVCDREGATLVDYTPELAGQDPAVYSSDQMHINFLGQKLIAAKLFARLAECGF